MQFIPTSIKDVIVIEPRIFEDDRGFFMESYHLKKFADAGIPDHFVQDNHSQSEQGVLRGLHYQIQNPQGKLVRVIEGEVLDVAVDIRKSSPTFGQWVSSLLSAENKKLFWVPSGFAHGFCVISKTAQLLYKCTNLYYPEHECCIRWDDPDLDIDWSLNGQPPLLSEKDQQGIPFKQATYYE